jgi:hypothetical protein
MCSSQAPSSPVARVRLGDAVSTYKFRSNEKVRQQIWGNIYIFQDTSILLPSNQLCEEHRIRRILKDTSRLNRFGFPAHMSRRVVDAGTTFIPGGRQSFEHLAD